MSDLADLAPRDDDADLGVDEVRKQWAKFQGDVRVTLDKLRLRLTPERFRKRDESAIDGKSIDVRSRWNVRSTLDLYARFTLTKPLRVRAKTSLYPTRYVAIKGEVSGSVGIAPDISLEIKLLDVLKYRMRGGNTNGGNSAQLRVRTPLKLKGAEMDVIYERHSLLHSHTGPREGVRVAFRFADAAYLKIPNAKVALKSQSRALKPFKTTLRIKRTLEPPPPPVQAVRPPAEMSALERLDRVGNILLGRRPTDVAGSTETNGHIPARPASSTASAPRPKARKRPERRADDMEEGRGVEKGNLFEAARKFLTSTMKAEDVGIDVKLRWIDTRE